MRKLLFGLVLVLPLGTFGCNQGTPGGPGNTTPEHKRVIGENTDTFNLSASLLPFNIAQGETKSTSISIHRGTNFDQDVRLSFSDVPKGVDIKPSHALIKHGDSEAKLSIRAIGSAALGDFLVRVDGHPTSGADASLNIKLTVSSK